MISHAHAILLGILGVVLSNGIAIGGGMYLDYRFKIVEKVEPYVTAIVSKLKRI